MIHAPKLKKLTHPVLLQVFKGPTIQRHLYLTSIPLLLHEKMLYNYMPFLLEESVNAMALVLSECCLLLNFHDAFPDDFPKITKIDSIFQQKR